MEIKRVVVLGAGPAGLAAALELSKGGVEVRMMEANDRVGGLSRTLSYKNNHFDIGPHRFFTKNGEIEKLWQSLLGGDLIRVPRLTRILYNNRLFDYPLKPLNVFANLGLATTVSAIYDYINSRAHFKKARADSFEQAIINQFGRKLFEVFFKTYTEKVWGIPCSKISADWSMQRIKGLNMSEIIKNAFFGESGNKGRIKSLVREFSYPVMGAGMMYEAMQEQIQSNGGSIELLSEVAEINRQGSRITGAIIKNRTGTYELNGSHYISSIPITELILKLNPPPPSEVIEAANKLYFRDHISVNLIIEGKDLFPDNWIYVHSPEVGMGRIANYGNFSSKMVAGNGASAITVEYFSFAGDDCWIKKDAEMIATAEKELKKTRLCGNRRVLDGFVLRERNCYPVYYIGYNKHLSVLKEYLLGFSNLQVIGRGGMYKYNNQDHSIMTGLCAARNLLYGNKHDIWRVNIEGEYIEEKQ